MPTLDLTTLAKEATTSFNQAKNKSLFVHNLLNFVPPEINPQVIEVAQLKELLSKANTDRVKHLVVRAPDLNRHDFPGYFVLEFNIDKKPCRVPFDIHTVAGMFLGHQIDATTTFAHSATPTTASRAITPQAASQTVKKAHTSETEKIKPKRP